jgi:hypothetical protein
MGLRFLIYILLFVSQIAKTQIQKFSYSFSDSSDYKNIINELSVYDGFFLGEEHYVKGLNKGYFSILNAILKKKDSIIVFEEYECNAYKEFKQVFVNKDTSEYKFYDFDRKDVQYQRLFEFIFFQKEIIDVIPIDNIRLETVLPDCILKYYNSEIPEEIENDIKIIRKIKLSKKKEAKQYSEFATAFSKHEDFHRAYLGVNFFLVKRIAEGIVAYINSKNELGKRSHKSSFREKFMTDNIKYEMAGKQNVFISFNGHYHIPLQKQIEWVNVKNWESLACRVQKEFTTRKICSIYLMNRCDDKLSSQYFPNEKKIILENTNPGDVYFIKIDSKNSPLNRLANKFQYIVVW